ncbi:MAG: hypothetical protein HGA66_10810, partial [Holophaga sp.]|nr:hypothetical protein [Holophaga sp.]
MSLLLKGSHFKAKVREALLAIPERRGLSCGGRALERGPNAAGVCLRDRRLLAGSLKAADLPPD